MTLQEYNTIEEAFKEAEKDDTPYVVATEGELAVVGDANKTAKKMHDFNIVFRIPEEQEDGSIKYKHAEKTFEKVSIAPRHDSKVAKSLTALLAYYRDVKENAFGGLTVSELTAEQKLDFATNMEDELYDAMYDVVAAVLGIDKKLKDYMLQASVLEATAQIIMIFTESANEADSFFGRSSAKQGIRAGQ